MPFKSKAQQRFLFANKPKGVDLKEWASHTDFKALPEKVAFFATEKLAMPHAEHPSGATEYLEPSALDKPTVPAKPTLTLADFGRGQTKERDSAYLVGSHHAPPSPGYQLVQGPEAVDALRARLLRECVAGTRKFSFFATEKLAALAQIPPTRDLINIVLSNRPPEQVIRARRFHAILNHPDPAVRQQGQQLLKQFNEKSTAVGQYMTRTDLESQGFRPKLAGLLVADDVRALGQKVVREMDDAQLRKLAADSPSPQRYTFLLELQRRRRGE